MTQFIHDDFLLHSKAARRLYHEYAAAEPILDYHSHLPPAEIASNRRFTNLFEIWLEGDHYKWRAMRANGVPEFYCTGKAAPYKQGFGILGSDVHRLPFPAEHRGISPSHSLDALEQLFRNDVPPDRLAAIKFVMDGLNAAKDPTPPEQGMLNRMGSEFLKLLGAPNR